MGNGQSSTPAPRFASACRAFAHNELEDLKSLFESLASQSKTDGHFVSPSVFKAYFGIDAPLGDRMFDLVTQKRNDQKLTFEDLVIAKGSYEKGMKDEIEEFIYQLVDVNGDGILTRSDLESVLSTMLDNTFSHKHSDPGRCSHQDMIGIFLNAANFSRDDKECAENSMSLEEFRKWCALVPSARKFLGSLLMPSDTGSQVPRLLHMDNVDSNSTLLREEYAWHIGGALPQQELEEWKLLYHSAFNGRSFSTFMGNILADEGPTVLIIKDKEGHIYGGYASQPWERHADFYGDMKSFLFQLSPKASIFKPSGANNNLQWCAFNFTSENIPNGIGFGGKINYLGLFISANLNQGHSFACTTFGSPCLSKTNHIYPEVIECWGVVPKEARQERENAGKGSVLERFKEDRHLLNMVGLANSSK